MLSHEIEAYLYIACTAYAIHRQEPVYDSVMRTVLTGASISYMGTARHSVCIICIIARTNDPYIRCPLEVDEAC